MIIFVRYQYNMLVFQSCGNIIQKKFIFMYISKSFIEAGIRSSF